MSNRILNKKKRIQLGYGSSSIKDGQILAFKSHNQIVSSPSIHHYKAQTKLQSHNKDGDDVQWRLKRDEAYTN